MPAAQMRTFEHEGQTLHCLAFVSSCIVCGHRWKDEIHEAVNSHHVEEARAVATGRKHASHDAYVSSASTNQRASESQPQ